ncbi:heme NO-binding domain-containing protein [Kordiimonas laminariae]|uniref:heme NO-binding domain-containing protein n=1 Tax=Kordiimonas laminariae TaxID=2917717 RepID=UPI001FF46C1B|nr:heme NO-binding domain-containing protein [Kordiimonas laminariae]MCK0067856.1 heme NO-binding domain-containing protein [Kordiimonas laminariae]
MKGIVFTEFLSMVDEVFSPLVTEEIILACDLKTGGAYTSVGTYDYKELIALVVALSKRTETPVPQLVKAFGEYLFFALEKNFPEHIDTNQDIFSFLESIEDYIHIEVKKLYPDAQLPTIACEQPQDGTLLFDYKSRCPFADLAEGLITACAEHFKIAVSITREKVCETGTSATFMIQKMA